MTNTNTQAMNGNQAMEDPDRLAQKLIRRAENRDGVFEISVGIAILLVTAILTVQMEIANGLLLRGVAWRGIFSMALVFLLWPAIGFALPVSVKWVRARFLIKRTGVVELKPPSAKRRLLVVFVAMIVSMAVAAALAAAVVSAARNHISSTSQWVVIGTGVLFGVLAMVGGRSRRFAINGAVIALAGFLLGMRNVGIMIGCTAIYGVAGAITVITGTVVLLRFLRETQEAGD